MEQAQGSKRTLLIDDDAITNMINTTLITRKFNFTVSAYTNAQEALKYLQTLLNSIPEQIPDIIFLDINMPLMDGWEFLNEFQKLNSTILEKCKVYMLTSSIDVEDVEKSKTYACVCDFISKPLTVDKLKILLA